MRSVPVFFLVILAQVVSLDGYSQWKSYIIGAKGDTLNCVDMHGKRQGRWVNHYDDVRGEPGYEEEGVYRDSLKVGLWRLYDLQGDLTGLETYKWGMKDSICTYYGMNGSLLREESWRAMNPDKAYDTLEIEDVDHPLNFKKVIVKNDGVAIKDGEWKYYDPSTGMVARTEVYTLGKLDKDQVAQRASPDSTQAVAKPREVLEFEKRAGKKKVKVQDGSVY